MERATFGTLQTWARELKPDSPQTHQRLMELMGSAKAGDQRAKELLITMVVQLMRTGLGMGAM
jgi:hypothetical protein